MIFIFLLILFLIIFPKDNNMVNAVCVIQGKVNGVVHLQETNNKTLITGYIKGLTPGKHGFHIHETGDLTDGCTSLCAHYNPFNKNHGGLESKERHVGDLGNIVANDKGIAKINILDKLVKLKGKYSVIGRSIVVHENEDDLGLGHHDDSLTTGHAGKRIGCGVIGYAKSCK